MGSRHRGRNVKHCIGTHCTKGLKTNILVIFSNVLIIFHTSWYYSTFVVFKFWGEVENLWFVYVGLCSFHTNNKYIKKKTFEFLNLLFVCIQYEHIHKKWSYYLYCLIMHWFQEVIRELGLGICVVLYMLFSTSQTPSKQRSSDCLLV